MNPTLKFFNYRHLPDHLQVISQPIHKLAHQMVETQPGSAELSAGLRKLLEAKDCFVRASLGEVEVELPFTPGHTFNDAVKTACTITPDNPYGDDPEMTEDGS